MPFLLQFSLALAVAHAVLKPLSDGLFDTSMWVSKILAPPDAEDNDTTRQFLKFNQAALMEGWLSNVPFISSILLFSCIIAGFLSHWWAGILMYFVSATLGVLVKMFFGRSVSYYLAFLYQKMISRVADYRKANDADRLEAAESYCRDLEMIIGLYQGSHLRPPTAKQLKGNPYGDLRYWLNFRAK
jgi:hypothetical protein